MGIFRDLTGLLSGRNKTEAVRAETSRKLRDFLQNQIESLDREGERVIFNEITIGYISHIVMMITKKPVSISVVRHALTNVFTDETSLVMINNAIQIFSTDIQSQEKLTALFPIAKEEYEAGYGEFLIRNTRQIRKEIDDMFVEGPVPDLSKEPRWTANDLA